MAVHRHLVRRPLTSRGDSARSEDCCAPIRPGVRAAPPKEAGSAGAGSRRAVPRRRRPTPRGAGTSAGSAAWGRARPRHPPRAGSRRRSRDRVRERTRERGRPWPHGLWPPRHGRPRPPTHAANRGARHEWDRPDQPLRRGGNAGGDRRQLALALLLRGSLDLEPAAHRGQLVLLRGDDPQHLAVGGCADRRRRGRSGSRAWRAFLVRVAAVRPRTAADWSLWPVSPSARRLLQRILRTSSAAPTGRRRPRPPAPTGEPLPSRCPAHRAPRAPGTPPARRPAPACYRRSLARDDPWRSA